MSRPINALGGCHACDDQGCRACTPTCRVCDDRYGGCDACAVDVDADPKRLALAALTLIALALLAFVRRAMPRTLKTIRARPFTRTALVLCPEVLR